MDNLKTKTICVVDNGLFVSFAELLAKDFGTVLFHAPWASGYPKSNILLIGQRIPGVKQINSFWPMLDDIDIFFFPDVYDGPLQCFLRSLGKRVWGGGMGEELELCRAESKEHLKSVGIDIGPYQVIKGLDALREHLKAHQDQWIKISRTRGDMETFYSKNYRMVEPRLDELEHQLGAKKKVMEFIVEDGIPAVAEVGYDGFTIDGQFSKGAMFGIEVKDKGFVMKTTQYAKLPTEIRSVNDKLIPTFKEYGYRGFWSTEIRVAEKDRTPYVIDPCARAGSPPSELYQLMVKNWAQIIWEGAAGNVVEPEFAAPWGAELLLISDWGDSNWLNVEYPRAIKDNVKLRYYTRIEGRTYVVPQAVGHPEVGAVVAVGSTMDDAIKNVREIADKVRGYFIDTFPDSLDDAQEQFKKLNEAGIKV